MMIISFLQDSTIDILPKLSHFDNLLPKSTNSTYPMLIPALISAVVAFLIFIFTQFFSWYFKQLEKQLETESYRSIILHWIDSMDVLVKHRISACQDFVKRIKTSENIHPERFNYTNMLAEKVDNISLDRIIKTFIINSTHAQIDDNEIMTSTLVSQFHFLSSIESEMRNEYNSYKDQLVLLGSDWNKYFKILYTITKEYSKIINYNKENPLYDFHIEVLKYFDRSENTKDNYTAKFLFYELIIPLKKLVDIELKKNVSNSYALEISNVLLELQIIILMHEVYINGTVKNFEDFAIKIEIAFNELIKARDYFKDKTNVVNRWKIK